MRALRKLKWILAALVTLAFIGTAGFHYLEGWSWFDGFYFVVITFTSIGYGEVHELSRHGRMFNIGARELNKVAAGIEPHDRIDAARIRAEAERYRIPELDAEQVVE